MISMRRQLILEHFKRTIAKINPKSILEVGAGEIENLHEYFPKDIQFDTLDPDPSMKPTIVGFGEKVKFKKKYDLILALEVLEHVYDPDKFLKNLRGALTKDGTLLLSVPFLTPIHMEWDYQRYTGKGLQLLLKKYFSSIHIAKMGDEKDTIMQILHMQYRKRALIVLRPILSICLSLLKPFKIKRIGSTTGYFAIVKHK